MAAKVRLQQSTPPAVVHLGNTQSPQQQPRDLSSIKGFAITQLVVGILTLIFGIAAFIRLFENTWTTAAAPGLWAGACITATGMVGVMYSVCCKLTNNCLSGLYMACCIISTIVCAMAGICFIAGVLFYVALNEDRCRMIGQYKDCSYRNIGLGLSVASLILMAIEFFVSIVSAIFTCQNACCGNGGLLEEIVLQPPQEVVKKTRYVPTDRPRTSMPRYGGQVPPPQYNTQVPPACDGQPPVVKKSPYTNVAYDPE